MQVNIADIRIEDRHRKDLGNIESLAASIAEVGLLHPVVITPDKRLIAGERRIAAAKSLGWDEIPVTVLDLDAIVRGEVAENRDRLDFSPTEMVDIARDIEPMERDAAKERQGKRNDIEHHENFTGCSGPAMDKVAAAIGVTRPTLEKAIDVVEVAEEDPQMFGDLPEMMDKKRKVDGAYREMKKRIAQDQAAQEAQRAPHKATVRKMDAIEFLEQMPVQSVDLLLTDPPYMTDVDDINEFAASWVTVALDRLKTTGRAYIFTGAYPQELAAYLGVLLPACAERGLVLANVLVWTYENTLGPSPKDDYKLNWQAAFYIRGTGAPPLNCPIMLEQFTVQKVRAPDGRLGDRYHAWQKPDELAERLIRHSTVADQLVVDPFAGTGTFILAAARLGRYAYGCDNSDAMLEIARQRGCDYEQ